ncbi:extracellular solute-binding protein [Paenibacillus nanensis]|uniref:Extracellular solute-binding protein n=1 Tax=Paenibacillus nanensis TaxID=393251 RepID=A0A3A1VIX0_9BACL|nr:extracellular solute-binding protein [Paenibacillus nanensis]RIX59566.1 extracellular solute-binding protein [Paenibacillus nanensis]
MRLTRLLITAAILGLLASCGVAGRPPAAQPDPTPVTITYVTSAGNAPSTDIIEQLAEEYTAVHPHVRFRREEIGNADLSSKIQLLAASNDLPVMFSYPSGKPLIDLIESGAALNLDETLEELDMNGTLLPSAVDLLNSQVDGRGLYALPLEMNIEGFWYNKELFSKLGIEVPGTWSEMMDAAEKMMAEGIQPFALAGKEKWPITRLINAYIIRKLGPDAMGEVDRGTMRLTDAGFIEAAEAIRDMAARGYFGRQPAREDFEQSMDMFMQGKAGIFYSGSWSLRDFNGSGRYDGGESSSIGFFSIPLVEGGVGTLDEYPVNAGLTTVFSKEAYNDEVGRWMKYVFERYGQHAMDNGAMITGFAALQTPGDVPALTRMIQDKLTELKRGALWFEARFTTEEQLTAWDNAQLLIADPAYSAERYMGELQKLIDDN